MHSKGLLRLGASSAINPATMMLTQPHTLASSHSGCPGLGPAGRGEEAEAETEGLGQAVRPLSYLWLRPLCPSFPNVPPYAFAPPVGVQSREVVDNLCINLSAWGLLVRWCLSGFRSCQMSLPEPMGEGGL